MTASTPSGPAQVILADAKTIFNMNYRVLLTKTLEVGD